MPKGKTTPAQRRAAARRVIRGESTAEVEGRRLRIHPSRMEQIVTQEKEALGVAPAPETPPLPEDEHANDPPELREARASAFDQGRDETRNGAAEVKAEPVEAPTSEQLIAFAELTQAQVLKFAARIHKIPGDDPRLVALYKFTKTERESLDMFAPYAVKFVPAVLARQDEIGAWCFVGTLALLAFGRYGDLKALRTATKVESSDTRSTEAPPAS